MPDKYRSCSNVDGVDTSHNDIKTDIDRRRVAGRNPQLNMYDVTKDLDLRGNAPYVWTASSTCKRRSGNGLEVWRGLYVECEGGAEQVHLAGAT